MPTQWLDEVLICPASAEVHENRDTLLAAHKEELADLRLSILLTARWEVSGSTEPERRNELRKELRRLRRRYFQKIDDIAMAFCVQNAMEVHEEVEREVILPADMVPFMAPIECDQLRF
jgi:hypothetical protein